jgi:hypothetical protein
MSRVRTVEACIADLPKAIKLGAYDWKIALEDDDRDLYGEAVFATDTIHLWPKNLTSASFAVGIVIHECLHVIYDHQGLEKLKRGKDEREEQIVLGFQDGLVSLFRDNPKLMTWMRKYL